MFKMHKEILIILFLYAAIVVLVLKTPKSHHYGHVRTDACIDSQMVEGHVLK
jgi:hypothetical protein